jgi:hypothetical protein
MSLVRRGAVGVSRFVVGHASAFSREWAEGLAREVEVIAGDWEALGWAVGSLPVLLDRREAPLASLAEVPAAVRRLGSFGRYPEEKATWLVFLYPAIFMGENLLHATHTQQRAGYGLALCGWVASGISSYFNRPRRPDRAMRPIGDWTLFYPRDIGSWTRYYKSELETRLDRLRSPLIWVNAFALLCVCAGLIIGSEGYALANASIVPVFTISVPFVFYGRWRLRRRLDRLNELLVSLE